MLELHRILLIRRKAVGDVLVSMAVAAELRRRYPHAHLGLVVDRFAAPAVEGSPLLDEVLVYDRAAMQRGHAVRRAVVALGWLRRLRRGRWDTVLDLMGTPQTALWAYSTGAPVRVGRSRRFRSWAYTLPLARPQGPPRFAGDVFLDWVRALGVADATWRPVPIPRADAVEQTTGASIARPATGAGPRIVLNASATWPAKAWPLPHFAALAGLLRSRLDATVLLAWGPGEEAARDWLVERAAGALTALPATDLVQLAAHLARVDLLITTDSGPKHIAVAEGTPTLTLFGSTDPRGWQPPGPRHDWITHEVACRPCDLTHCPVAGHPCLDLLLPDEVAQAAADFLVRLRGLSAASTGNAPTSREVPS